MAKTMQDYRSDTKPIWCPGCGDYAVLNGVLKAFAELELEPSNTVAVSGIGCSSRAPFFMNTYGYHGLHGRALPTAMGVKVARPDLTVLVMGGDGDGLAIGAGHFPHACRRNLDITYIMMDNFIYGLTKGQASPTTHPGHPTKSTPEGPTEIPLDPAVFAITFGATFVARGFSGQPAELQGLFAAAVAHTGFSLVQVLSPCMTFYDTYQLVREATAPVEEIGYDISDPKEALLAAVSQDPVRLGILYRSDQPVRVQGQPLDARPSQAERLAKLDEVFARYV